MKTMVIGIAGGTGSGKTTLTRHLVESFGGHRLYPGVSDPL